jgi:small subunit ribosomal protein S6
MRKYELMYIVRSTLEVESRKALIEELNQIMITRGTTTLKVNEWGTRELAYEIANNRKGYYVLVEAVMSIEAKNELDRVIGIKEDIIRHMIVSREEK